MSDIKTIEERFDAIERNQETIIRMLSDLIGQRDDQRASALKKQKHLKQYFDTVMAPLRAKGMDVSALDSQISALMNLEG